MPLTAPPPEGNFELLPEATHLAVCDMIVNLGLQPSVWSGKTSFKPKVYFRWQVPAKRITIDDKDLPMVIGSTYTLSLSEKANLRRDVETWLGRALTIPEVAGEFELDSLLGKACQVSVTHNKKEDRTYANVAAVIALPDGIPAPLLEGESLLFNSTTETPGVYEKLRPWLQEKINSTMPAPGPDRHGVPYQGHEQNMQAELDKANSDFEDDIPF
ncbi:MAG: hypothetical protein QGF90_02920 [Gammaproteobacteria bacterium]|nr:hypothetical protein [Gammaproteobacteria bacterium]